MTAVLHGCAGGGVPADAALVGLFADARAEGYDGSVSGLGAAGALERWVRDKTQLDAAKPWEEDSNNAAGWLRALLVPTVKHHAAYRPLVESLSGGPLPDDDKEGWSKLEAACAVLEEEAASAAVDASVADGAEAEKVRLLAALRAALSTGGPANLKLGADAAEDPRGVLRRLADSSFKRKVERPPRSRARARVLVAVAVVPGLLGGGVTLAAAAACVAQRRT